MRPQRDVKADEGEKGAFARLTASVVRGGSVLVGGIDKRLEKAVRLGDKKGVEALLAWGANPNARMTPVSGQWDAGHWAEGHWLTFAALYTLGGRWGDWIFKLLLDAGADANARDDNGKTLMMEAAERGETAAMGLLVDAGANLDLVDARGWTALHHAASARNSGGGPVGFLLEKGAQARMANKDGATPLMMAGWQGKSWLVDRLAPVSDVNAKDGHGRTALMLAAKNKESLAGLTALLRHKADVGLTDAYGLTALMAAAGAGNAEAVRELLAAGADARVATESSESRRGMTALRFGVESGSVNTVEALLAGMTRTVAAEAVNAQAADGQTPMGAALNGGHQRIFGVLREFARTMLLEEESKAEEDGGSDDSNDSEDVSEEWLDMCKYENEMKKNEEIRFTYELAMKKTEKMRLMLESDLKLGLFESETAAKTSNDGSNKERAEVLTVVRQGSTHTRLAGAAGTVFVEKASLDKDGMLELDTAREGDVVSVVFSGEKALTARNETALKAQEPTANGGLLSAKRRP